MEEKKEPRKHIPSPWTKGEEQNTITEDLIKMNLPFAGATEKKAWWLSTDTEGNIYQAEMYFGYAMSGIPAYQLEAMFSESVVQVSVPVVK